MISLAQARPQLLRLGRPRITPVACLWPVVGLGCLLRLYHFLRLPSVWHDEAALLINVLHLDFRQMLGPLLIHEAAPPLFLMSERAIMLIFGDGIVALRMLPFLAACASVVLTALLARRLLTPHGAVWATALFAVSDRLLWHAVEAKPYSIDVLIAVAVAYAYQLTRHWRVWQQCLLALPILPALLWLSFPACFVAGGWFAAQIPALRRSRSSRDWFSIFILAIVVMASFICLADGPAKCQRTSAMESCWTTGFPDWQRVWLIPIWIASSTIDIFCYCIPPQGWMCVGVVVAGAAWLQRRAEGRIVTLLFIPLVLVLGAALAGKYPYCGMRVLAFMTPAFCLAAAAGIEPVRNWTNTRLPRCAPLIWLALALPFLNTAWRLVDHWPRVQIDAASEYVIASWKTGDSVGFNHWEGQYYFRDRADRWLDRAAAGGEPPERIWYVATSTVPAERDSFLGSMPGPWRLIERREYQFVSVGLFVRTPAEPISTSADGRIP